MQHDVWITLLGTIRDIVVGVTLAYLAMHLDIVKRRQEDHEKTCHASGKLPEESTESTAAESHSDRPEQPDRIRAATAGQAANNQNSGNSAGAGNTRGHTDRVREP